MPMLFRGTTEVSAMWPKNHQVSVSVKEIIIVIWLAKYIIMRRLTLTSEFSIDHDIQMFLWVSTDVSGDGVQANGGIIQCEAHSWAVEPWQTPGEQKTAFICCFGRWRST